MFRLRITTGTDTFHADLPPGLTELGRGPARDDIRRVALHDPTVSRDHLRMTPVGPDRVRVENLSSRFPIRLSDGDSTIAPGDTATLTVPVVLVVGETRIEVSLDVPNLRPTQTLVARPMGTDISRGATLSVLDIQPAAVAARGTAVPDVHGGPPEPATLAQWFEAITAVQTAPPGSAEFYQQAADAIVELIGMHTGLVLLGAGPEWQPVARSGRPADCRHEYSTSILRRVCEDRRTLYHANVASRGEVAESLVSVGAVVASPILAADGRVLGALYGSRSAMAADGGLASGGVGELEAHAVQMLATTVGIGLDRVADGEQAAALWAEKDAAERAKFQFLANVGDELRTPLTAILGHAEQLIAAATASGADHLVPNLTEIRTASTHLLTVLEDLLDPSKHAAE